MITIVVIVLFVQTMQAQTVQNDTIYGKQLLEQAKTLNELKKYNESTSTALKVAAIFQKAEKWELWYEAYKTIFYNGRESNTYEISINLLEKGLLQLPDQEVFVKGQMQFFLGVSLEENNYNSGAIEYYQKSYDNISKVKPQNLKWQNWILGNLSIVYMKEGDHWKAQEYAKIGISYAEKAKDTSAIWKNTKALGQAYFYGGEFEKAQETFNIAQQIRDDKDGTFEFFAADILYQSSESEYEAAENLANDALRIAKECTTGSYYCEDNVFLATKLLGEIYLRQDQPTKALQQFETCLKLIASWEDGDENGKLYILIGDAYADLEEYDIALENYQTALKSFIPDFESTDSRENPLKDSIPLESWVMEAFINKGYCYMKKFKQSDDANWLQNAAENFELALNISEMKRLEFTETTSKLDFGGYVNEFYEVLLELKLALFTHTNEEKYLHEAFQVSQRANAFVLRELINAEQALQAADIPKATIAEFKQYKRNINIFNQKVENFNDLLEASGSTAQDSINSIKSQEKLFQAKEDFEKLKKSIASKYPKFDKLRNDLNGISVAALQKQLNENTLLVKYFLGEKTLYTFSITKESFHVDQLPLPNTFKETVKQYRKSLSDRNFINSNSAQAEAQYLETAVTLYKQLLEKPLQRIENKEITELIIIPDGVLHTISFTALRTQPSKSWTTLDHAVIKKYAINHHYFCKMIANTYPKVNKKEDFASFGVSLDEYTVNYMQSLISDSFENKSELALRNSFSKLTFADEEASQLAKLMKGKVWLNENATKENFLNQATNANSIHLASHAIVNIKNPNTSAIIFNKTKDTVSNLLRLEEIYHYDFNAEMITLSACNTGFGKYEKGEGLQSLARAFNFANIPSVTATLWSIPDASSAKIMNLYYTYLQEGHSKHVALQKAQIAYVEDDDISSPASRLPFYWSAWTHIGDHSTIKFQQQHNIINYIIIALLSLLLLVGFLWFKKKRILKSQKN